MQLGPWWIDTYTLRLVGACVIAGAWLWLTAPRRSVDRARLWIWMWILTLGVLAAGRAGYVLIHRPYFAQNPTDVINLRRVGGLHGPTAWGGALLVILLGARMENLSTRQRLGWLAPAALVVAAGAWWGCMDAGCAWGRETLQPPSLLRWLVTEAPDLTHSIRPRYAVRAVGLIGALVSAGLAVALGQNGGYALALYLALAAGLTFLRGDPMPKVGAEGFVKLRWDALLNGLWAALVLGFTALSRNGARTDRIRAPE